MSLNIFLHKYTVHIPSVARARILPTVVLRRPMIYIDCYNGCDQQIVYPLGSWDKAKNDFDALQHQMNRCQRALSDLQTPILPVKSENSEEDSYLKPMR